MNNYVILINNNKKHKLHALRCFFFQKYRISLRKYKENNTKAIKQVQTTKTQKHYHKRKLIVLNAYKDELNYSKHLTNLQIITTKIKKSYTIVI